MVTKEQGESLLVSQTSRAGPRSTPRSEILSPAMRHEPRFGPTDKPYLSEAEKEASREAARSRLNQPPRAELIEAVSSPGHFVKGDDQNDEERDPDAGIDHSNELGEFGG